MMMTRVLGLPLLAALFLLFSSPPSQAKESKEKSATAAIKLTVVIPERRYISHLNTTVYGTILTSTVTLPARNGQRYTIIRAE
jgi:hypothetical protein